MIDHLTQLRAWILHWQDDATAGLAPTRESLMSALSLIAKIELSARDAPQAQAVDGWRYEIQHGPEGETDYAWVYRGKEMICTTKTHHAIAIVSALTRPSPPTEAKPVSDAQIKHMVERFLRWKLPEHFSPDGGISFQRDYNQNTPYPAKHEPVGTNLFDYNQATEMVRHMLADLPTEAKPVAALVETSIDTMREAANDELRRNGWHKQPNARLALHQVKELMAAFGMHVYRGEVGCDWPNCGCCADAACADALPALASLDNDKDQRNG